MRDITDAAPPLSDLIPAQRPAPETGRPGAEIRPVVPPATGTGPAGAPAAPPQERDGDGGGDGTVAAPREPLAFLWAALGALVGASVVAVLFLVVLTLLP